MQCTVHHPPCWAQYRYTTWAEPLSNEDDFGASWWFIPDTGASMLVRSTRNLPHSIEVGWKRAGPSITHLLASYIKAARVSPLPTPDAHWLGFRPSA